ncbi:protein MAINTENANCE OF PSII UNDER HIGH LIGHT 1 [Lotus japonicus]|uniref:protein MAINTENANCE OF PSII UNDER HIGH LIGHT 1 n=1 Tax=Lotus japonicus TaxID=34305 RepID=UPI00258C6691|nr:protein MAINTENANCE OF PSII UNDER HIGH LIGHT 1 [Lotus japonicus]
MSCALQATLASNTCAFSSRRLSLNNQKFSKRSSYLLTVRANSDDADCNDEECAPDKEVGKISVEWLAGEKTKVVGTFPPRRAKGWTGYVEKDTAGQTNIYSVEPAVYVAESVLSSGTAGSSKEGAENTAGIVAFLALISIAAASSILLQVGKTTPPIQRAEYSGPSLSYYISKFKPPEITQAPAPIEAELPSSVVQPETAPEVSSSVAAESEIQPEVPEPVVQPESSPPQVSSSVEVGSEIQPEPASVSVVS